MLTSRHHNYQKMKRFFSLALLVAAPGLAIDPPSPNWPRPADRGDRLLRSSVLEGHNVARRSFGVAPLMWSEELAAEAMAHASYMARTGIYAHDRTAGRRTKSGENIWRGQRGLFSYETMVQAMVSEGRLFRPGVFPNNSANGRWQSVAHYTQIIWPTTSHVGCALASSPSTDYFVCRYSPGGNRDGVYLAAGEARSTASRRARGGLAEGGD